MPFDARVFIRLDGADAATKDRENSMRRLVRKCTYNLHCFIQFPLSSRIALSHEVSDKKEQLMSPKLFRSMTGDITHNCSHIVLINNLEPYKRDDSRATIISPKP